MTVKEKLQISGLIMRNYKEPLRPIPENEGVGYYGALIGSDDGLKLQCHICGELVGALPGHIWGKHKLKTRDYKAKFELAGSTKLISEEFRQASKERTLAWLKTLTPEQLEAWRAKGTERMVAKNTGRKAQQKLRLETHNIRGNCPDQTLQRIVDLKDKLGHTPSMVEMMNEDEGQSWVHSAKLRFGSWKAALDILKLTPKSRLSSGFHGKHSDEQLLEYLRVYTQENGHIPTTTDCKRGLIPSYEVYARHFGTFQNARELAHLNELL